ncbi:MAG: 3-phosphoshikimate 1-carboxyvinyltransferase [Candidatus Krumholzibacteria bacterium]|nr:3-phosphoshikimate 1-carboxyvinyltransferase [Candidatus Krumholzibacteria bacterium]
MLVQPAERLRGTVRVPGDKSIAHRALIIGSMAKGKHVVEGAPAGADLYSTVSCLRSLGAFIEEMPDGRLLVLSKEFVSGKHIDAGNSGTTARLLSGLLAGLPGETTIDGDESLRGRPMDRIVEPLSQMGADIATAPGGRLPITIRGGRLKAISHQPPVASAQVKSAILIAGLMAEGITVVEERVPTRDHTERLLAAMAVPVEIDGHKIAIRGGSVPRAAQVKIPGDLSSAAFFVVASVCVPGSELYLPTVGINPTRTGAIRVLQEMGASIELINHASFLEEPIADIVVKSSELRGTTIGHELIPSLIDELPIIAVAATQAEGETTVSGAKELRYKESDRIAAIVGNLKRMGADIEARDDGFVIRGPTRLKGNKVSSLGDHRVAMAMTIAGLLATGQTHIERSDIIGVSYPSFFKDLQTVSG